MSKWKELCGLGMEVWFDDLSRELITTGRLKKMIEEDGVSGITSNPTIFENSIKNSRLYIEDIRKLSASVEDAVRIHDEIVFYDIRLAARAFEEMFDASSGEMGYVSLELSPLVAHDAGATVSEAERIYKEVGVENLMLKVPATEEGIVAIKELTKRGYNINATLIFTVEQYERVARAYVEGLMERKKAGLPVSGIKSVASVFLSRIDTYVDLKIDELLASGTLTEKQKQEISSLKGRASTALGRLVYSRFLEVFGSEEFSELEENGAWIQKPLWASTGTKNPAYSDVKYVEEHIYPDSVVTVPAQTFEAFKDHGNPALSEIDFEKQNEVVEKLLDFGIDLGEVGRELLVDGEKKFVDSYMNILNLIEMTKKEAGL